MVCPFARERMAAGASGQASCHAPLSAVKITIVLGASARIVSMKRPTFQSSSSIESEYRPRRDLPANCGAGLFGLCIFTKLTSIKKRLVVLAVFLNVFDGEVSLPNVEGRQIVPVDASSRGDPPGPPIRTCCQPRSIQGGDGQ